MRALALLTLLASAALADGNRHVRFQRFCGRSEQGRSDRGFDCLNVSPVFDEFAPPDGGGMGTVCACMPVTTASGRPVTFTRTTNATCTRGGYALRNTGIFPGDLVYCAPNMPRIETTADGGLGIEMESTRTNNARFSSEFENGTRWALRQTGAPGLPLVTPDVALAPDNGLIPALDGGLMAADRIDFPAVTGAEDSYLYQDQSCTSPNCMASAYLRAVSGSCAVDVCVRQGSIMANCVRTTVVSTSFSRPSITSAFIPDGGFRGIAFGAAGTLNGANGACSVIAWGAQAENTSSPYSSSYIPNATDALVDRLNESASIALPATGLTSMCLAATVNVVSGGATAGLRNILRARSSNADSFALRVSVLPDALVSEVNTTTVVSSGLTPFNVSRVYGYATGTSTQACVNASCVTTAATAAPSGGAKTLFIGTDANAANTLFGIVSAVQVASDISRCTP